MNSPQLTELISSFVNNRLSGESHFLVGVRVSSDLRCVTILLDGDSGVDVDFCARMSREIGEQLEGLEEVPAYVLEVSSPGADTPMKLLRQFPKHIGRTLLVRLKGGVGEVKGELKKVNDENLYIRESVAGKKNNKTRSPFGEEVKVIPFIQIEYARVIIQM
ncbi:MAG: ribosome maturation factor RimP [Sphingomonadales bacterium]|nr:ribosome maturation factor RimP [Sphingomonadales bacterium]